MKLQAALSRFESARANLEAFRKEYSDIVEDHDRLRESYNVALAEVKAIYKDNHEIVGKRYGEFKLSVPTHVDAEKLLKLMGAKADPLVNVKYSIVRDQYDKAVEKGLIPSDVIDEVQYEGSPRVSGPKEL